MSRDARCVRQVRSTHGSRAGHTIEQPIGCRATKTCARGRPFLATPRKRRIKVQNSAASPTTEAIALIVCLARNESSRLHVLQEGEPLKPAGNKFTADRPA